MYIFDYKKTEENPDPRQVVVFIERYFASLHADKSLRAPYRGSRAVLSD